MRTVSVDAADGELIDCVGEWVDLMAAGDLAVAVDFLCQPREWDMVEKWTPESLKTYIGNYGSWEPLGDGEFMQVTAIGNAQGPNPFLHEVMRAEGGTPRVEFTVPLNGEWSDLTAIFEIVEVDGKWAFFLYDLRVL